MRLPRRATWSTRVVHDALFWQESVAVRVTSIEPVKGVPGAGLCVIVTPPQLSLATACARRSGTVAGPSQPSGAMLLAGQVMTGAVVSVTITVWTRVPGLPQASVADQVRVIV